MMELKTGSILKIVEPNQQMIELAKEVLRQNEAILEINKKLALYLGAPALVVRECNDGG